MVNIWPLGLIAFCLENRKSTSRVLPPSVLRCSCPPILLSLPSPFLTPSPPSVHPLCPSLTKTNPIFFFNLAAQRRRRVEPLVWRRGKGRTQTAGWSSLIDGDTSERRNASMAAIAGHGGESGCLCPSPCLLFGLHPPMDGLRNHGPLGLDVSRGRAHIAWSTQPL